MRLLVLCCAGLVCWGCSRDAEVAEPAAGGGERPAAARESTSQPPPVPASTRILGAWRYAPPYELYDVAGVDDRATRDEFLDPTQHYFAVRDEHRALVGYCCFGAEARVPGWDYDDHALDIGVGMRPDLTGQGHGAAFTEAVIAFGLQRFPHARLRATVAAFNARSQRVCRRQGLHAVGRFVRTGEPALEFVVFERPAPGK